ncbi:MAG: hypothetical protein MRZ79_16920 [Bacteroidia bacterium]|nr:hypothetical protein [Bacteroidia bacterium]
MRTFFLIAASLLFLSSCKMADLSNEETKSNTNAQAKAILEAAAKAHGVEKWNSVSTYEVSFKDEFYGAMGNFASPYKGGSVSLRLQYIPKQADAKLTFTEGKSKGEVWGLSQGITYKGDMSSGKEAKDATFWLPTYQYFIEFPARILEAEIFRLAGKEEINGRPKDMVFVSWKKVEAQKDFDQYIVWVDQESKLISKVAYTIREANNWVTGHAMFEDLKDYGGIIFPTKMPVGSNLLKEGKLLHTMSIEDVKFDSFARTELTSK